MLRAFKSDQLRKLVHGPQDITAVAEMKASDRDRHSKSPQSYSRYGVDSLKPCACCNYRRSDLELEHVNIIELIMRDSGLELKLLPWNSTSDCDVL